MTGMSVTKTRLEGGVWEGVVSGAAAERPVLLVTHAGEALDGVELTRDEVKNLWCLRVPIPAERIDDGVQTFVISDGAGTVLTSFALLAGEALADDIRAELDLLRAELDLLKQAFRRHCQGADPSRGS